MQKEREPKMPNYIINTNTDSNGYNEVHNTSCNHLPEVANQVSLGYHIGAEAAVSYAKSVGYKNADGCYYCCNEAHHG